MGTQAHIYFITAESYSSVLRGDIDGFSAGCEGIMADLDKAWHAIHYLITGNTDDCLLSGGVQIPDVSEQFEAYSPEAIRLLYEQLSTTTLQQLMRKFDPELFNAKDIYPSGWDDSRRDYVEENLERFITTIRQAANAGKGIAVLLA